MGADVIPETPSFPSFPRSLHFSSLHFPIQNMISRAASRTMFVISSHIARFPPLHRRYVFVQPQSSSSSRFLSSSTPYPLYYELISYSPVHRTRRRRRPNPNALPAEESREEDKDEEHGGGEERLDRAKRKYYLKREKRLYGDPELERESGSSELVELDPEIVDFPRLHAREEELYFYDAMAFPWEKEKHYKMVYQLEKKYFPDQSLDKAFLEVVPKREDERERKREEKGLVFFDKTAAPPDSSGSEKKVEEFFKCLKKVPGGGGGATAASSGEPCLASRKTGLPPRWDGPSGTVLLVDKPKGWTSFTVCGKLRRLVKVQKVGHAGTLDPMATGLLIVCVGKATKVVDRYQAMFKSYSGIFRLGEATSTWDADSPGSKPMIEREGNRLWGSDQIVTNHDRWAPWIAIEQPSDGCSIKIIQREPWEHIKDDDIKKAAESFSGEIWQVPPMFSAIKVGGEKMYEKARRGETVELSPRRISIFQFDIERSLADRQNLVFRVICSKGTYIRSLCADLGKALGSCAHLTALRRDSIGQYSVEDAWDFQELQEQITKGYL